MTTIREVLLANAPQYVPAYDAGYPVGFQALQFIAPEFLALCPCGKARWSKVKLATYMRIVEDPPTETDLALEVTRRGQAAAIVLPEGVVINFEPKLTWFRFRITDTNMRILCLVGKMDIPAESPDASAPIWLYLPIRGVVIT